MPSTAAAPVRAKRTTVADVKIHAVEAGEGPPLVVLHHSFGNPGWLPFHEALAADFRVIAPDLPGFGTSTCPTWARDVRDLAALTSRMITALADEPVVLVGLGFGGWVAAEMVAFRSVDVSHLVLVGAAGILPRAGRIADQMLVAHGEYVRLGFSDLDHYRALYGDELSDETLIAWDVNREMVSRVAWKPYMYNRRLEPLLSDVDVPSLIVWGDDDRVVPLECGERYAELLRRSRLEVLPGGHAIEIECPNALAKLVVEHTRASAQEVF